MPDSINTLVAFVPNWLGDAAMCTPALRALRHAYPDAELTVVGRGGACALLKDIPWLDRFVVIPSKAGWLAGRALRHQLAGKPDLAVIFPHSFRAALLAWACGARKRIGYARNGRSFLLTHAVEPYKENGHIQPIYMGQEYLTLVETVGGQDDNAGLELHADANLLTALRDRLNGQGPLVGLAPGAAFGPSKRWPPEYYAQVADDLAEQCGARCVILTGPGEEDTRAAVLNAAKFPVLVCDDGNPTLDTLKATIAQLDVLVCNDSGPRHVAIAFKVPTVCLMGSTSPQYSEGPYERGAVLRVDVDCGPCQKPECETDHRCMTRLDPAWAIEAAEQIIRSSAPDSKQNSDRN